MSKKKTPIIVTVGDDALPNIKQVADQLSAKGMKVDQVLPTLGVITGSYDPQELGESEQISGVDNVEVELKASLSQ